MSDKGDGVEDGMNFQELAEIQSAERGSTSLTRLPDQFYDRATTYLRSLMAEMENMASESSGELGEEHYRVSEEYRRSKDILDRIYSTRERKIVLAALNASRGINHKSENMIHDEEELYFSLKVELEDIRERILKYDRFHRKPRKMRPETGINTTTDDFTESSPKENVKEEKGPTRAPMMDRALADLEELGSEIRSGAGQKKKEEEIPMEAEKLMETADGGLVIVRAKKDIEPFMGPNNRTISMASEDVASLPPEVAKILVEGGLATIVGD